MNLLSQMTSTPIDCLFKVRHQDIFEGKDMRTLSHLSVSVKVQGRFISVLSGTVAGNSACHSRRVLYGYHCTVHCGCQASELLSIIQGQLSETSPWYLIELIPLLDPRSQHSCGRPQRRVQHLMPWGFGPEHRKLPVQMLTDSLEAQEAVSSHHFGLQESGPSLGVC